MIAGIPRTLSFYTYYPLWKTYLEGLGAQVVLSRPTNREILEWGLRDTVTDACIPIKILHGHVIDLRERVDCLFVPRMVSADGRTTFCPKFLGLPDMVRFSGAKLPPVIDSRFRATKFSSGILPFFAEIARRLGVKPGFRWAAAARRACRQQHAYMQLLRQGILPHEAMRRLGAGLGGEHLFKTRPPEPPPLNNPAAALKIALLGYPYVLYDPFLSANLYGRLVGMGVNPLTPEQLSALQLRRANKELPQHFFWYYSNRVALSSLYYLEKPERVDGVIHVTAFGCGPDAMVDKFVELEAKKKKVPFLTLTIDEHTGEGGIQTRLEAFVDMLRARQEHAVKGAG